MKVTFAYLKTELIKSAATPKAVAFAEKIAAQIEARGAAWIDSNAAALKISGNIEALEKFAPVADNRAFFLSAWQLALAK